MKTIEIKNEGGVSIKYDIVNIGCKDCPYCMMAEGHYLCRSDKSCNAKANMTDDDDEPKQKVTFIVIRYRIGDRRNEENRNQE